MLNRLIRFSLASVFALAIAGHGVANADHHEDGEKKEGDAAAPAGDAAKPDSAGGDAAAKPDATPPAGGDTAAPAPAAAAGGKRQGVWDARLNERARTNPKSVITIGAELPTLLSFDIIGLSVFGRYGVSDQLEVGLSYNVLLDPSSDFKGPFLIGARYNALSAADMDLTIGANIGYDINGESITPLTLTGVFDKLLMDRKLNAYGALSLPIGIEDPQAIAAFLSAGAWYQASGTAKSALAVGVNIPLAGLALKDAGDSTFIGADFFAINVGAFWSNRVIDVGVMIGTDLKNEPGDSITATLSVGYNMGGTGPGAVQMK